VKRPENCATAPQGATAQCRDGTYSSARAGGAQAHIIGAWRSDSNSRIYAAGERGRSGHSVATLAQGHSERQLNFEHSLDGGQTYGYLFEPGPALRDWRAGGIGR
jgi:hypothetical protein